MWKTIDAYVKKYQMIGEGDCVLIGLSGGPDSVYLARYLLRLRDEGKISLRALHVNHLLREEEAERDEEFVRSFCRQWEIPCRICREDVFRYAKDHRCSVEEAGRLVRRSCLFRYAEEEGCTKIALAHHRDDLAETMIFRMIRGTGPEGLPGIRPVDGKMIRPLLCAGKEEIIRELDRLGQEYVEDSSNSETDYTRNRIRHMILPEMAGINEKAALHLAALSTQVRLQNDYVERQMDRLYDENVRASSRGTEISLKHLRGLDIFEQKELIRRMIFRTGGRRRDISSLHVDLVLDLPDRGRGKGVDLPYGLRALLEGENLVVRRRDEAGGEDMGTESDGRMPFCAQIDRDRLESGEEIRIVTGEGMEFRFRLVFGPAEENPKKDCVGYFNYDKIKDKLLLRKRQEGDYLIFDRLGRKKLLRRYLIDEKIPYDVRGRLCLLAEEHHIIWVPGRRISEAFRVHEPGVRVLRAEAVPVKDQQGGNKET